MAGLEHSSKQGSTYILSETEARTLVAGSLQSLKNLEEVINTETKLISMGHLREALEYEPRKSELGGVYMRELEKVKANAVSLARFAPQEVKNLKQAHQNFEQLLDLNQTVLATAKAVSEILVKTLADEVGKSLRPTTYGAAGLNTHYAKKAEPLLISKNL